MTALIVLIGFIGFLAIPVIMIIETITDSRERKAYIQKRDALISPKGKRHRR